MLYTRYILMLASSTKVKNEKRGHCVQLLPLSSPWNMASQPLPPLSTDELYSMSIWELDRRIANLS